MNDIYQMILNECKKVARDKKSRDFMKKTLQTKYEIIGVYSPELKKIFNRYRYSDLSTFKEFKYYEMNYLFVAINLFQLEDITSQINFLKKYHQIIDSWAICDTTYQYLTPKDFYEVNLFYKSMMKSNVEMLERYGYLILFNYQNDKKYISKIFSMIKKSDKHYVSMVEAWLLANIAVNFPEVVYRYLSKCNLNKETIKKAISKIQDSYRINKEYKEKFKELRKSI